MPNIIDIESRFKEVTGLQHLDLSVYHFKKGYGQNQKTTKEEYDNWGFVCTPIWLVDEMIEPQMNSTTLDSNTCDACCGCGQFSIRLLRKLYTKYPTMDIEYWLAHKHVFTEFQFTNVAKLIYIFGTNITVYAGDTRNIVYARQNESGILYFKELDKKWYNLSPDYINLIEQNKDNLANLIKILTSIEKIVMPPSKPKKVTETKILKPKTPDKPKVIKPIEVKVDDKPVVIKEKPKPVSTKSKKVVEDIVEEPKIGGLYKPTIDFGEDL